MRSPVVLTCDADGRLAAQLRERASAAGWTLRDLRHFDACLRQVARADPVVLVLKVGCDLTGELALLERITWLYPHAATIVVGDTDHPELAGLAWDLGAGFVLFPPLASELLPDVVAGFLQSPSQQPQSE